MEKIGFQVVRRYADEGLSVAQHQGKESWCGQLPFTYLNATSLPNLLWLSS